MSALDELLKKYKDAITPGNVDRDRTYTSLGPLSLNLAIGNALGIQGGHIVQLVGKYSSGKSTLALDIVAQHQRATGLPVIYADFERAYQRRYAESIGVDTSLLHMVRADTTEEGLSILEKAIKTGDVKLAIVDSIAAAKPSSEDTKDYSDSQKMGGNSPIVGRFINRILPVIDNNDCCLIILNQLRANFNTLSPERDIPAGGKALHYATTVMIQLTNIKNTEDMSEIQAVIKKNRVGSPRKNVNFVINYGRGIDHSRDILELAIQKDIVAKSGAWFNYAGIKAQGMEQACEKFPIEEIKKQVLNAHT